MLTKLDYSSVVTNLLRLTGLDHGETSASGFRVDSTSIPIDYANYLADSNNRTIGIFEIAGYYHPDDKEVVIFEKVIADWAAHLSLNFSDVRAVVLCHEGVHMVTHLGSGHGANAWQNFRDASMEDVEFYAQIYAHFFLQRELPELVPVLQALSEDSPPIYCSYLKALPCPMDIINEMLYADRKGEKLQLVLGASSVAAFDQLAGKIEKDSPVYERDLSALGQSLANVHVGSACTSIETIKRTLAAKNGV